MVKKYLVTKLGLSNESEVIIIISPALYLFFCLNNYKCDYYCEKQSMHEKVCFYVGRSGLVNDFFLIWQAS